MVADVEAGSRDIGVTLEFQTGPSNTSKDSYPSQAPSQAKMLSVCFLYLCILAFADALEWHAMPCFQAFLLRTSSRHSYRVLVTSSFMIAGVDGGCFWRAFGPN